MHHHARLALSLAAAALVAPLAACSSPQPARPDAPAEPALDVSGRWRSACVDPGNGQAIRLTFELTDATWRLDYEAFGDAACASPFLTVEIEGPYAVLGASGAVPGAYEGRFDFARKAVTPHGDAAAGFLTEACGGAFVAGEPADLAAGCAALGAYPIADCPSDHDLVARDGDTLRFGQRPADNDMCTPAKRPTALSPIALSRR